MSETVLISRPLGVDYLAGKQLFAYSTDVGAKKTLCARSVPCGRNARIVSVQNDVDPGAENFFYFQVLVNGTPIADPLYSKFGNNSIGSVGPTYDPSARLNVPLRVPEGAYVELVAVFTNSSVSGSAPAADYYAYGRMVIEYEDR